MALSLASSNSAAAAISMRLSHDFRNTLATLALHLDTLERLSGQSGAKAASAARNLVSKAAGICTDILLEGHSPDAPTRRTNVDIICVLRQIADLLQPIAPESLKITVSAPPSVMVLGNASEVFRVLFNLAHNAVMVARRTQRLNSLEFSVERAAATVLIHVRDDGPGLPKDIRSNLFGRSGSRFATTTNGFGLAIARELAERNGGTLEYDGSDGTTFTLVLSAFAPTSNNTSPVTRMLGKAAMRV
jgi:signal transduction histidine kinase